MDESARELMANMEQGVSEEEEREHAGLPMKYWNMIQIELMERMGREMWTTGGSKAFQELVNSRRELVKGFGQASKQEQGAMIDTIEHELSQSMEQRKAA